MNKEQKLKEEQEEIEFCKTASRLKIGRKFYQRKKHGEDSWADTNGKEECWDCGTEPGRYHIPGCDHEDCPKCGEQAAFCDCKKSLYE